MSTLIGFTIFVMLGLLTYMARELYINRSFLKLFVLWVQIFAITIAISAFVQDVKSSNTAEFIYVFCGIIIPSFFILFENKILLNKIDIKNKIKSAKITIVISYKKFKNKVTKNKEINTIPDISLEPIDSVSPGEPEGYLLLGDEYSDAGLFEEALECYKRYTEIKRSDCEGFLKLGVILENLGDIDGALSAYKKSVNINPYFIEGYKYYAGCLCIMSRYNEAIDLYVKAINSNPSDYTLYYYLGIVCEQCKRYPEAAKSYKMALEINPTDQEIIYHLGAVFTELRKYDEAISAYKMALLNQPEDSELFYNLSIVYSLLHKPEIAIDNLRKAIELNKNIKHSILRNKVFDSIRSYPEFKRL